MKNKSRLLRVGALLVAAGLVLSCSSSLVTFPSIHIDDIDPENGREVTASATGFQLLLFIPIGANDRQLRAFQALKAQAGADAIADIKIKESWTYAFVGTLYQTTMTATAYPRRQ